MCTKHRTEDGWRASRDAVALIAWRLRRPFSRHLPRDLVACVAEVLHGVATVLAKWAAQRPAHDPAAYRYRRAPDAVLIQQRPGGGFVTATVVADAPINKAIAREMRKTSHGFAAEHDRMMFAARLHRAQSHWMGTV